MMYRVQQAHHENKMPRMKVIFSANNDNTNIVIQQRIEVLPPISSSTANVTPVMSEFDPTTTAYDPPHTYNEPVEEV